MPSTLYLKTINSPTLTPPSGSQYLLLSNRTDNSSITRDTTTTASGTAIDVTAGAGGDTIYWFTEPITTAVTVSGTMTVTIRARESATTVNACLAAIVERTDNAGAVISTVLDATVPDPATELPTTIGNATDTYTPTSTSFSVGDRIKLTLQVRNIGTMGAGTVTIGFGAPNVNTMSMQFAEDIVTDQPVEVGSYEIYGSNGYRR